MHGTPRLTPDVLLAAYAQGIFPMAERRDDAALYWVSPEQRGIIPLDRFHVPRRLARTVRADRFAVTSDCAFGAVIEACAQSRPESWINAEIVRLYTALYAAGHAHSVECWQGGALAGGLYGVSLGGAFFGESMFSLRRDASKVALVHLVAMLRRGGFRLLDAQFQTAHLQQFGTEEIPRADYIARLEQALRVPAYWPASAGRSTGFSASPALGEAGLTGLTGPMVTTSPGATALHVITQAS